jgi:hypothetical protein
VRNVVVPHIDWPPNLSPLDKRGTRGGDAAAGTHYSTLPFESGAHCAADSTFPRPGPQPPRLRDLAYLVFDI